MSSNLLTYNIAKNSRTDDNTGHPFFSDDDDGSSNIAGGLSKEDKKYNKDRTWGKKKARYSQEKIISQVSDFNKYYSISDNDNKISDAYNREWGESGLENRVWNAADKTPENGRMDGVGKDYIPSFHMAQDNEHEIYNNFSSDSIKGNLEPTEFSRFYFSEQNVMNLQRQIKLEVKKLSRGRFAIDNQCENALKTVMRSYFLQYKMSNNIDVLSQIKEVNKKVIEWCADNIFSHLLQYEQYKKDITTLPVSMPPPVNVSIKGNNSGYEMSPFSRISL